MIRYEKILNQFEPSEQVLLKVIAPHIDNDMLREISKLDYGHNADEHFLKLAEIRDIQEIEKPFKWEPKEVLQLHSPRMGKNSEKEFLKKIFTQTALLCASGDPENNGWEIADQENILYLLEAIEKLGWRFSSEAMQFHAWLALALPKHNPEYLFSMFAIIWLALMRKNPVEENKVLELLKILIQEEEEFRQSANASNHLSDKLGFIWLAGFAEYRAIHWVKLIQKLQTIVSDIKSGELTDSINKILDNTKT